MEGGLRNDDGVAMEGNDREGGSATMVSLDRAIHVRVCNGVGDGISPETAVVGGNCAGSVEEDKGGGGAWWCTCLPPPQHGKPI